MILNPYRYGSGASVSFISAAGASYIASGTSINTPSSPAGIANGDGLFAVLFARSALTPPAGWTLVASKTNVGTLTQTLHIYRKDSVTTGDSSTAFTWSQAASGRMGLSYIVVRSTSGAITIAATSDAETDYAVSTAYPQNATVPTLSASVSGELFLIAVTAEGASATAAQNAWTAPSGATARTTATQADNRLCAFTQSRNSGQSNSTPAAFGTVATTAGANFYSAITVRLQP